MTTSALLHFSKFDVNKLTLQKPKPTTNGSSKLSMYFFKYDDGEVPKIELDFGKVLFPIRYETAPQLKLSLTASAEMVTFFTQLNAKIHELLVEGEYIKQSKELNPLVSGGNVDDDESDRKLSQFVRVKIGDVDKAPFEMGVLDLAGDSKTTETKNLSVEELQAILPPKAQVKTIISLGFAYISSLAAGVSLKLAAIAYNTKELQEVINQPKVSDPLKYAREVTDIDIKSLTLKPLENNASIFAIQDADGKSLKLKLPPTKITMRPQFDVDSKPKLHLAVNDANINTFFESLEAWVQEKKNANKAWKKLKYFGILKPSNDPKYPPRLSLKFNGGADGLYSINWFGDNEELYAKYDGSKLTINAINEIIQPRALVQPVISVRSVFVNKTMLTIFAYVDALNIIGYPNKVSFSINQEETKDNTQVLEA